MASRNAFGILTDALHFVHTVPQQAWAVFREAIESTLHALGIPAAHVEKEARRIWRAIEGGEVNEGELRRHLTEILGGTIEKHRRGALDTRAERIASQVAPLIVGERVLDWGCGDGRVAEVVRNQIPELHLLDIVDRRELARDLPFVVYDEHLTPPIGGTPFDTVLLLTVLHHAQNPGLTLRHAVGTETRRVILIESVPCLKHSALNGLRPETAERARYEYCGFIDWFYNRIVCDDVQVTFNYLRPEGWIQMFAAAGFSPIFQRDLGIDQDLVPEWHHLTIFEAQWGKSASGKVRGKVPAS